MVKTLARSKPVNIKNCGAEIAHMFLSPRHENIFNFVKNAKLLKIALKSFCFDLTPVQRIYDFHRNELQRSEK